MKKTFMYLALILALTGLIFTGYPVQTSWATGTGVDRSTEANTGITYAHHEIHSGSSYMVSAGQTVSDTNDRTAISLVTGNTAKWCHMIVSATAGASSWFYVREGATITDNQGATLTVYNRNRNSPKTSGVIDTSSNPDLVGSVTYFAEADQADYTENGALIYQELLSSGNKSKGGGDARGTTEIILKQNTVYLFYLKATNNDDNIQNIILDWYEHTNKN